MTRCASARRSALLDHWSLGNGIVGGRGPGGGRPGASETGLMVLQVTSWSLFGALQGSSMHVTYYLSERTRDDAPIIRYGSAHVRGQESARERGGRPIVGFGSLHVHKCAHLLCARGGRVRAREGREGGDCYDACYLHASVGSVCWCSRQMLRSNPLPLHHLCTASSVVALQSENNSSLCWCAVHATANNSRELLVHATLVIGAVFFFLLN